MKIGKCSECERKKVYIEKDGKCLECLKTEGDKDSTLILCLDICEKEYGLVRNCIEHAKSKKGFVRIQHDTADNLKAKRDYDLDVHEDNLSIYGGSLHTAKYYFKDYDGRSEKRRVVQALIDAYEDLLSERF